MTRGLVKWRMGEQAGVEEGRGRWAMGMSEDGRLVMDEAVGFGDGREGRSVRGCKGRVWG